MPDSSPERLQLLYLSFLDVKNRVLPWTQNISGIKVRIHTPIHLFYNFQEIEERCSWLGPVKVLSQEPHMACMRLVKKISSESVRTGCAPMVSKKEEWSPLRKVWKPTQLLVIHNQLSSKVRDKECFRKHSDLKISCGNSTFTQTTAHILVKSWTPSVNTVETT